MSHDRSVKPPKVRVKKQIIAFIKGLLDHYTTSFRVNCDSQAAALAPTFAALAARGMSEIQELLVGLLFGSLVERKGRVLAEGADGKAASIFILGEGEVTGIFNARDIARPASVVALILVSNQNLAINDIFDDDLNHLDQHCMNVFIPDDYRQFGDRVIEGANFTYEIGEGIWRVDDFISQWRNNIIPAGSAVEGAGVRIGALNASMLFPNRICWFLFA